MAFTLRPAASANPPSKGLSIYFPSLVARFTVMLDAAYAGPLPAQAGSPQAVAGLAPNRLPVSSPSRTAASGTPQTPQAPQPRPDAVGAPASPLSSVIQVVPRRASIELPGFRQAGKFSMTVEFRDFPIPPNALRGAGVALHADTVTDSNFAAGMTRTPAADRARASVLVPSDDNLVLGGFVDTISVDFSDSGAEVTLEGRDYRGALLDTSLYPGQLDGIHLDQPIDQIVRDVLALHPSYRGVTVTTYPDDWPDGIVPTLAGADDLCRARRGASGSKPTSRAPGTSGEVKLWDIITKYCYLVGGIPWFDGYVLVIRPAPSVFDLMKANPDPQHPTPFDLGKLRTILVNGTAQTVSIRQLVYGRDIKRLKFERKLGGTKVPAIEVVGLDTASPGRGSQKLLTYRWPQDTPDDQDPTGAQETSADPSGASAQQQVQRIPIHGVRDPGILKQIAQSIYEEIGRGELGGSFDTDDCASYGGDNSDPDLLTLRPGDPIQFSLDLRGLTSQSPLVNAVTDFARGSEDSVIADVASRLGGDVALAAVLVRTARGSIRDPLGSTYRISNVKYDWNQDGIRISADFQNYVEARYDITQPASTSAPNTQTPQRQVVPGSSSGVAGSGGLPAGTIPKGVG